jgi:CSLREA domain-containing protein
VSLARLAHQSLARRRSRPAGLTWRLGVALLLVAVATLAPFVPVPTASAAIIVVNSLGDEPRDPAASAGVCQSTSGPCTLRAALATANTTEVDQVVFDPAIVPSGSTATINLTLGQLTVDRSVVIRGPTNATLQIDGQDIGRVFEVAAASGATVQITDLTVQNGQTGGFGGGIVVTTTSTVVLERVVLQDNVTTGGSGGGLGLTTNGAAILRDVIVRNNQAASNGGGLYTQGAGCRAPAGHREFRRRRRWHQR